MEARLFLYAFGIWILLVFVAILNGYFRNIFLEPSVGKYIGHVISSIILSCLIFLITFLFLNNVKITFSHADLLVIGAFWLILTVLFEFVFGHYVIGHPWSTLLADYNILKGRLWGLVLLATFIAPLVIGSALQK